MCRLEDIKVEVLHLHTVRRHLIYARSRVQLLYYRQPFIPFLFFRSLRFFFCILFWGSGSICISITGDRSSTFVTTGKLEETCRAASFAYLTSGRDVLLKRSARTIRKQLRNTGYRQYPSIEQSVYLEMASYPAPGMVFFLTSFVIMLL